MTSIKAEQFVRVISSVLGAGGNPLDFNGLFLTDSYRVPIGEVYSFPGPDSTAVAEFFGASSPEAAAATVYFLGFDNSTTKPNAMLFANYNRTAVGAWLQGGDVSALTIPQLQALSGTLTIAVDGATKTSGAINLSSAVSFSSAAALIETAFNAYDGITANTSTIAAGTATNSTIASITGDIMTVGGVVTGGFVVGGVLSGTGVAAGTSILEQLTGATGLAGTYRVSAVQSVPNTTITQTYGLLTVAGITSGYLAPGQVISGGTTTAGTAIVSQVSGTTGGIGTYVTSGGSQTVAATTISAGKLTVSYDSVAGAFLFNGGTPGVVGTIGYASGSLSTSLKLTLAEAALISQGAAVATPVAFMQSVVNRTQNWVTLVTIFDPDAYGNSNKQAFASWANSTNVGYIYAAWDTDLTPFASTAATTSLAYILKQSNSNGTCVIQSPDCLFAAFVAGSLASVNYSEHQGLTTMCFRSQTGLTPYVTDDTSYTNMIANGANSYLAVATRNQGFNFFGNGSITGDYLWVDAYANAIWLNNQIQLALMTLLTESKSIPNNETGRTLIRAACNDPLNQAVNFGMVGPGDALSTQQAALINNAAGKVIDKTLENVGYYLQILPSTAQGRALRSSPPITLWYRYNQSIQKLDVASVQVQ